MGLVFQLADYPQQDDGTNGCGNDRTDDTRAQAGTIRLKLLKIGALVRVTVRKIWISFSQSYPYQEQFLEILAKIRGTPPVVLRC